MTPAWNVRNFLLQATLLRDRVDSSDSYPFSITAIHGLDELAFAQPVTVLGGENGAGKSTLLEAIAVGCRLNPEVGSRNFNLATRASFAARAGCVTASSCAPRATSTSPPRSSVSRSGTAMAAARSTRSRTASPSSRCS